MERIYTHTEAQLNSLSSKISDYINTAILNEQMPDGGGYSDPIFNFTDLNGDYIIYRKTTNELLLLIPVTRNKALAPPVAAQ